MATGKKDAHYSSKLLSGKTTPKIVKSVAGSDLSQTRKKKSK